MDADYTSQLPVELLQHVLDYLPLRELQHLARVSKRLRQIVKRDQRFYISLWLQVFRVDEAIIASQRRLIAFLQHAISEQLPVSLDVHYIGPEDTQRDFLYQHIFPAIELALPILARLRVVIPDIYSSALQDALKHPAPYLRELELSRSGVRLDLPPVDSEQKFIHIVSVDIFRGHAPQLFCVNLCNISPGEQPIPAFSNVHRVGLSYDYYTPRIQLAHLFPKLRNLKVSFDENPILPPSIICRGLTLDSLVIADVSTWKSVTFDLIDNGLDVSPIPMITILSWKPPIHHAMTGTSGPVSLHVTQPPDDERQYEEGYMANIVILETGFRRVLDFNYYRTNGVPFNKFQILASRLVYIRVDYEVLLGVLKFKCDLPVLRRLQLDLRCDENFERRFWYAGDLAGSNELADLQYRLPCPLLERVIFSATDVEIRKISPLQVAYVGAAFGQLERAAEERAQLHMFGVEFDTNARRTLIDEIFSRIEFFKFARDVDKSPQELGLVL
ncbi:hypothetical protein EXIGLDRAFT_727409 [Exidia glandulosa HHB12029]|uniref:F-box domain-containing protein n=1 Tax=Exidia glandulosa HHB12029 TaxID=1314781 RepID=A0A165DDM8_EXIGL|nr:hypothetical protein EXIGLDRAFT_727409 [Exidia glandulosa HHB12029]